eukprot:692373-Rhodomonas_salina.1
MTTLFSHKLSPSSSFFKLPTQTVMVVSEGSEGSEESQESQESQATAVNWCDISRRGGRGAGARRAQPEGPVRKQHKN